MRRFGVELELKGLTKERVVEVLAQIGIECQNAGYTHTVISKWKVVHDSSVRGGVEVVSPPMTSLGEVKQVAKALASAGGFVDRSCGVHVHIDCNDLNNESIVKISKRYGKFESKIDQFFPSSRRNSSFCKSCNHSTALTDRYHKVNLQAFAKYGTVEFRQHAGSLNGVKITKWITFCSEFVDACMTEATVAQPAQATNNTDRTILTMIADGCENRQSIAEAAGVTMNALASRVSRMRAAGVAISKGRTWRLEASAADDLFRSISQDVVEFLNARAVVLRSH